MTDVRPILGQVDVVLNECDASALEPLAEPPVVEPAPYHPDTAASDYVTAHLRLGETVKSDPMRRWLRRWFDRVLG